MVPRKSWGSENFSPISESQQRFHRVSEAPFFLVWFRNHLSLGLGFSNKGLGKSRILPFAIPIRQPHTVHTVCHHLDHAIDYSHTIPQNKYATIP